MIRFAREEDRYEIAPLLLVILKDMELSFVTKVPEKTVLSILEDAILEPTYRYSYKRGLVYERNGQIAGVAFGYPNEEEPIIDLPFKKILRKFELDEALQLFTDPETLPNEWYLDSISVDKIYRGEGIGSKLLDALPEIAKRDGKHTIGLNVDKKNPKAKKLYRRKGFKTMKEIVISKHLYEHMQKEINCVD